MCWGPPGPKAWTAPYHIGFFRRAYLGLRPGWPPSAILEKSHKNSTCLSGGAVQAKASGTSFLPEIWGPPKHGGRSGLWHWPRVWKLNHCGDNQIVDVMLGNNFAKGTCPLFSRKTHKKPWLYSRGFLFSLSFSLFFSLKWLSVLVVFVQLFRLSGVLWWTVQNSCEAWRTASRQAKESATIQTTEPSPVGIIQLCDSIVFGILVSFRR